MLPRQKCGHFRPVLAILLVDSAAHRECPRRSNCGDASANKISANTISKAIRLAYFGSASAISPT